MRTRLAALGVVCVAWLLVLPVGAEAADSNCPRSEAQPNDISVSDYAASLLCVVNETRREWGRPALIRQRNLRRAADWQSDDMVEKDYFSHTSANGDTLSDRLDQFRFIPSSDRWRAGENLAAGSGPMGTPEEIVSGWMNSRDHRINLLDPGFSLVGIGVSRGWPGDQVSDSNAFTITMDLGWRRR
jgi:uncharacterized protein YkwD